MTSCHQDGSANVKVVNDIPAVLHELWPDSAEITKTSWPAFRRSTATLEYIPVPLHGEPTLFLPRRPRIATATAVRNYKTSATPKARRRLKVLSAAARLGAADLLPRALTIRIDGGSRTDIVAHLERIMGYPVHLGIHVGPARAVQKPVLQLIDAHGRTRGFAKVGTRPLTRRLVHREAENLRQLSTAPWDTFRVPRVLHTGQWNNNEILVLEALTPTASAAPTMRLAAAMCELAATGPLRTERLLESAYWSTLTRDLGRLASSQHTARISETLRVVSTEIDSARAMSFGASHGDWTPWNMAVSGEQVILWDLEYYRSQVPVGFDALHFHIQSAIARGDDPTSAFLRAAEDAGDLLGPHGVVDGSTIDLTVALYAVDLAVRYLTDGELQAGTTMGQIDSWLFAILDRQDRLLDRRHLAV